jgi:hypothetical protein
MSDVIERRVINIPDLIEAAPIGAVQYRIVTLWPFWRCSTASIPRPLRLWRRCLPRNGIST